MWNFQEERRAASVMPVAEPEPKKVRHGWAALGLPETGWILVMDRDQCQLCPASSPRPCQRDCLESATCDSCKERILAGKLPLCVESCPHGAIWVGSLDRNNATNGIRVIPLAELLKRRRFAVEGADRRRIVLRR